MDKLADKLVDKLAERLVGTSISQGTVIERAYVFYDYKVQFTHSIITEVEDEFARFVEATESVKRDFALLYKDISGDILGEHAEEKEHVASELIQVYTMFLEDVEFHKQVKEIIEKSHSNAEWAVKKVIEKYIDVLSQSEHTYMVERIHDFNEIGMKVIQKLNNVKNDEIELETKCILVANNLYPAQLIRLDKSKLMGIILEEGGVTSHVSIIAKAYGIPMLIGVKEALRYIETGDRIVLHATHGEVILHSKEDEIETYTKEVQLEQEERERLIEQVRTTDRNTMEGESLSFQLNIDIMQEMNDFSIRESDGIGLFRSEFLLEQITEHHDSEEKQFCIYKELLALMDNKTVTIRSFDAGGDKLPVSIHQINEENPLLGYRGIRYSLGDEEFFLTQLRALLRVSMFGHVRILIPMVSCVEEMMSVQKFIKKAKAQLTERGLEYKDVPVGIMIEVPSIIYIMDDISPYCDFYSIGTNDLLQYSMAIDRGNSSVGDLYQYYHPSFLRLLNDIFYKANTQKKDISLCGEMASYEQTIPLLLGMGLRNFSVSPASLCKVIIQATKYSITQSRILLEEVLRCKTASEVIEKIEEFHYVQSSDSRTA